MKTVAALATVLLISPLAVGAQNSTTAAPTPKKPAAAVHHQANFNSERLRADALYKAGKFVEALPLYEDLCRQDPANAVFAERHGTAIITKAGSVEDPKQKRAMIAQGIKELLRAESLGDTDPPVEEALDAYAMAPISLVAAEPVGGLPLTVGVTYEGSSLAQSLWKRGKFALEHNDLPTALENAIAAAAADPNWYSAALLAGATSYRMGDIKDACTWFARAAAIDPDFHTAYRIWGNALMTAGDYEGARVKYEQAIAAQPYSKAAVLGLHQWATQTHHSILRLDVRRPDFTAPDGKLAADPSLATETGDGHASWLIYEQRRVAHGAPTASQSTMEGSTSDTGDFKFTPSGYVHTLDEEMDAITAMLTDVKQKLASGAVTQDKLEPSLKNLLALQKDNMLEPFILLSFNDAGIRHGYPDYRAGHRDQVVSYIDRYIIGPLIPPTAPQPPVRVTR